MNIYYILPYILNFPFYVNPAISGKKIGQTKTMDFVDGIKIFLIAF